MLGATQSVQHTAIIPFHLDDDVRKRSSITFNSYTSIHPIRETDSFITDEVVCPAPEDWLSFV